jgi:hypothetical protein
MIIKSVERTPGQWELAGSLGEKLVLPAAAAGPFSIGLLGTRSVPAVKRRTKTETLAALLAGLGRPIYLIDVRRDGVGSQRSWSPRELASLVPRMMLKWATADARNRMAGTACRSLRRLK